MGSAARPFRKRRAAVVYAFRIPITTYRNQ
jgi:hypothetical protein